MKIVLPPLQSVRFGWLPVWAACACITCQTPMKINFLPYPDTRRDTITDNYHGTRVADPYRWLEDDNSAETAAWVAAENEVTFGYLNRIPYRNALKQRLTELWNFPKEGIPYKIGPYYLFFKNDGLQNQSVLYRQRGVDGTPEVFLDPNTMSEKGTTALTAISFSEDDRYMAFSVAVSGSDWVEMRIMEVETGRQLPDVIRWVKFSRANWAADSKGFYYSRYDEPAAGEELSGQNRFQKVYYHRLGDMQEADRLIYADPKEPLRYYSALESRDGKYLFINVSEGTHGSEILLKHLKVAGKNLWIKLFEGFEYDYSIVECRNDKVWVYTNDSAPNYRLAVIDLIDPEIFSCGGKIKMTDVIPENSEKLLRGVTSMGGYLMASYLDKAVSRLFQHGMDGALVREVTLPMLGTAEGFSGKPNAAETFYALTGFTSPAAIYRYDPATGISELFKKPTLTYDPTLYTSEQVFYRSKDGTEVSMFLVHRRDLKRNGRNPVYLYGYGGFNISLTPAFSPTYILFMEQGGIVAIPNLRGGGEYGEAWHQAGMFEQKQNVFDDFIAAAEYLIAERYTSPKRLAIAGGSNGGLLVGACMIQRPELFGVALPAVGVMDMLRYHRFTVGWGWTVEYGSSDDPAQFEYLYRYSPLHNLKEGVCYPATLITTADHDDRVVPAHSFKFAARLQAVQGCGKPALIRIDTNAGHGAGKPVAKRIDETADVFSFLLWNTGSDVK